MPSPSHRGFLGRWVLIPESCRYEQGDPPKAGSITILEEGRCIRFVMEWTDMGGASHRAELAGEPDGEAKPFDGGALADALAITLVSDRKIVSSAFFEGEELMTAERQLDATGQAMRVVQRVRLPDGTAPINAGVYRAE
ncbi:MAG: hypothetical protein AB8I08_19535 [Sandaracinaceae bacterium]